MQSWKKDWCFTRKFDMGWDQKDVISAQTSYFSSHLVEIKQQFNEFGRFSCPVDQLLDFCQFERNEFWHWVQNKVL